MVERALKEFLKNNSHFNDEKRLAVGVSGGPDSMALAHAVASTFKDKEIFFITVDHGLRPEAQTEAQTVKDWSQRFSNVTHHTIVWEGEKPDTRIMQEARNARYALMSGFCEEHDIQMLFLGHHQDDQRETFFIRLSKGSGLDGLAAMSDRTKFNDKLFLLRPLLNISKDIIVEYCEQHQIEYMDDPSNQNQTYLRPRLREIESALEEEGLTSERLYKLTQRLARARNALNNITESAFNDIMVLQTEDQLQLNLSGFMNQPEEIQIRLLLKALNLFREPDNYGVRLEKLEDLHHDMVNNFYNKMDMKQRSLGHCLFAMNIKNEALLIKKEA